LRSQESSLIARETRRDESDLARPGSTWLDGEETIRSIRRPDFRENAGPTFLFQQRDFQGGLRARARTLIAAVVVVVIVGDRSGAITSRWRREAADSAEGRKKRFDACRCARHQSSS